MMSRLCSALVLTITILVGDAAAFAEGTGHYTIVASTQIRPHSVFTVALSLHDNPVPATVRLTIDNGQRYSQSKETVVQPFSTEKVIFETGAMPDATDAGYRLIAEGISGLSFRNESRLQLNEKRFSVLVQTDKGLYEPENVLRFRVMVLDPNTKPFDVKGDMQVQILDGHSNLIKEWNNVTTSSGIYENELQLSSFPVLGDWTIKVDVLGETKKKTVTLAEYVLPKFEVVIETAKEVLYLDGKIRATIRARQIYGKPIVGEATVTLQPKIYGSFQPFASDLISRKVIKLNGKGDVEFDINADLRLTEEYFQKLKLNALVEEERTGRTQSANFVINIRKSPFYIKSLTPVISYKPGLPFEILVQVLRHDKMPVKAVNTAIEIMFKTDLSADNAVLRETRMLDTNALARFTKLLPLNGTTGYYVEAKYLDMTEGLGFIPRADSAAGAYIQLKLLEQRPKIGETFTVDVLSSLPMSYLTYQLLGRGDILATETIPISGRTSYQLKFLASFAMVPMAEVILFYVRDGQLVSAKLELAMAESLQNMITLETSASRVTPGQIIDFTVNTRPNAFVGLMAVDQNAAMLKSGNDLSIDEVFDELKEYSVGYFRPYHHHTDLPNTNIRYRRSSAYPFNPIAVDFTDSGAILLSNLHQVPTNFYDAGVDPTRNEIPYNPNDILTKKKTDIGPAHVLRTNTKPPLAGPFAFSRIPQPKWKRQRVLLERTIENTWLFTSARAGTNGMLRLSKNVPETTTTWTVTSFSLDPVTGLAIVKTPVTVNVAKPIALGISLPPSINRGEVLSIPISVTSRLDSSTTVEVTLHNEEQNFEFVDVAGKANTSKIELYRRKRVTVKANEASATTFLIRPKKVGLTTIKVTASSPLYGDNVERLLSIEAEGVSQNLNTAIFVDLRSNGKMDGNLTLDIPKNAVPESIHSEVSVLSDILGSTIRNLGSLIDRPKGCGEQNLVDLVSNVIVLNYLKRTNQLSEELEANAVRVIEAGYQRELSYRHLDGSFSAFGDTDKQGSTWLTAFVVRSFRQASAYITIEKRIIDDALDWLENNQAFNGSFPEIGNFIHQDMQVGSGRGVALTAYTLLAFLDNKSTIPAHRNAVNKAMDYIVRSLEGLDDVYALSVAAYALQVADHNAKDYVLRILDSRALSKDGQKHWAKPIIGSDTKNIWHQRPNSVNTEITAYALLATIASGAPSRDVLPILKWLLAQRTEKGGFGSTQDTLVGLLALTIAGDSIPTKDTNIQVNAKYLKNLETTIRVSSGYSKTPQSVEIPSNTNLVNISATGQGVALVQLSYKYHLNVTGAWPRFTLDPQINRNSNNDYLHLTICTSFIQSEDSTQSNMAVMEVELPSGFTADLETIPSLEATENVKLVETRNQATVMVIYFENLGRKELCPTVDAFRTHKVAMQRPAAVTVYDYYDSSRRARMFYKVPNVSLCEICEAEDCTEACIVQASQQRSSTSDTESSGRSSDGKGAASSIHPETSLILLIVAALASVPYNNL